MPFRFSCLSLPTRAAITKCYPTREGSRLRTWTSHCPPPLPRRLPLFPCNKISRLVDNPRTQIRRVHPSRTISLPHQVGVVQPDHDYYHTIHEIKIQGSRNHKFCADWSCCGLVQRALYRSSYSISFYLTSITPRSLSHSKSSYCILEHEL